MAAWLDWSAHGPNTAASAIASGRKVPHDVPGSEFEIPLDTLILAISQHSVLDFFGDEQPALTERGYLDVDPFTLQTSIAGVYAGGDVAGSGPSSIVKAAAEGKTVARAIITAHGRPVAEPVAPAPAIDLGQMVMRRARREYRVPIASAPLDVRHSFQQTVVGYTSEEAVAEASRCLDCHQVCSLCVGVCPNMALLTYESEPFRAALPELRVEGSQLVEGERHAYVADQRLQIAVLTDFCNECGNCTTACPTSGQPYRDKPRLYLDRGDFEAQEDNAFMLGEDGSIEGRWNGETHRLRLNGAVEYQSPAVTARMDLATLAIESATVAEGQATGTLVSLRPAADMVVLLRGLQRSMAHLPIASGNAGAATRVGHPGYAEEGTTA